MASLSIFLDLLIPGSWFVVELRHVAYCAAPVEKVKTAKEEARELMLKEESAIRQRVKCIQRNLSVMLTALGEMAIANPVFTHGQLPSLVVTELAEEVWDRYGFEFGTDYSGLLDALSHVHYNVRLAAAEALAAALDENPDTIPKKWEKKKKEKRERYLLFPGSLCDPLLAGDSLPVGFLLRSGRRGEKGEGNFSWENEATPRLPAGERGDASSSCVGTRRHPVFPRENEATPLSYLDKLGTLVWTDTANLA
ncbi:hypothetical protein BHE74_00040611 [Ensete ventricosum]|nr:hypothetical protein BHE74_00040611 [Ensete ventricosum]